MRRVALLFVLAVLSGTPTHADDNEILKLAQLPSDEAKLAALIEGQTIAIADHEKLVGLIQESKIESAAADDVKTAVANIVPHFARIGPPSRRLLDGLAARIANDDARKPLSELRAEWETKSNAPDAMLAAIRTLAAGKMASRFDVLWSYAVLSADDAERERIVEKIAEDDRKRPSPRFLLDKLSDRRPGAAFLAAYGVARHFEPAYRARAIQASREGAARGLAGKRFFDDLDEYEAADRLALAQKEVVRDDDLLRQPNRWLESASAEAIAKTRRADRPEFAYLERQVPTPEQVERIKAWVADLSSPDFRTRDKASEQLSSAGPMAVSFLREAERGDDAEARRRATTCLDEIAREATPEVILSAIRSLARHAYQLESDRGVAGLLAFAPFTESREIEEALLSTMVCVAVREGDKAWLADALASESPARRAAAVALLGKIGDDSALPAIRKRLNDADPRVRYRAALAMIALEKREGLEHLVLVSGELPTAYLPDIEVILYDTTAGEGPKVSLNDPVPAARAKARENWIDWLNKNEASVDLARLRLSDTDEGLLTICENDGTIKKAGSRVWQRGRDGRVRWSFDGLRTPTSAFLLPNGRVLVSEMSGRRVVEFDRQGKEHWDYQPVTSPIHVQRLANGNTFIATYQGFMEIAPDKTIVHNHQKANGFILYSAERTRDGRVVAMTSRGSLIEYDAATGKELKTINNLQAIGQSGVHALPRGRYLIASPNINGGQVREIDGEGKVLWQADFPGAFRAIKLPSGNVIVGSLTTRKVAEIDRKGQVRWEVTCQGRPWGLQAK